MARGSLRQKMLLYKQNLVKASDTETVVIGRPVGRIRRVLQTPFAEKQGISLQQYNEQTSEAKHIQGAIKGDMESGFINSGQITGLIDNIPTVKKLLETMMKDANKAIASKMKELYKFYKK